MVVLLEESLNSPLRRELVNSLNTNDRYYIIIERLPTYRIPVFLNTNRMHELVKRGRMSPADWVIEELFDRMCSFDEFCYMLRDFDMIEELALLVPPEPMVIEEHPGEVGDNGEMRIEDGSELRLTCKAVGIPRPTYQWFYDNSPIPGQTDSVLSVQSFSEEKKGVYWCQVSQDIFGHVSQRMSAEVAVDIMARKPVVVVDLPRIRSVPRGQSLVLSIQVEGYPEPCYEWYRSSAHLHDGLVDPNVMPNIVLSETTNTLELKDLSLQEEGVYCCRAANEAGEAFTNYCNVTVFERPPDYIASAKVALLIGNDQYEDVGLKGLHAPSNDVATLSMILKDLGFHIIALQNLTHIEMYNAFKWFCSVLPPDAYAFFYFAGHGFSKLASKFMMPVDCPKNNIQLHHVLCDEHLTQILAEGNQLQLLVMLFDCCLIESRELSIGKTEFEHDLGKCNIVLGTATRNHQNAYERDSEHNGMFVKALQAHLADEMPIIEVLRANQREFRIKNQQPTIFFCGADNCGLTDQVAENPELQERLQAELDFPEYDQELHFTRIKKKVTIRISKHKDCFLNSIDLTFPPKFKLNYSIEVNSPDLRLELENKVVTMYDIQKVKIPLFVTVSINKERLVDGQKMSGPIDNCLFTINYPLIDRGHLWFSPEPTPEV